MSDYEFVLNKLLNSSITDKRQQAYVLATIKHETAGTFRPLKELGSQKYLQSKPYYPYIGRGYVQLTWDYNYKKFGTILGIDLINIPAFAQRPEIAWKITELGMTKGLFTGKSLSDYFYGAEEDWTNARKIINGLDKAELIAGYAKDYYEQLKPIDLKKFNSTEEALQSMLKNWEN